MADTDPPRVFNARFNKGIDRWYLDMNKEVPRDQRKSLSLRISKALLERRLLSSAEIDASGTFEPLSNTIYWFHFQGGDVPAFLHVTDDWLNNHGYLQRLLTIREFLLQKEVQERFEEIYSAQEGTSKLLTGRRGTVYEYGVNFQPGYGPGRTQLTALARAAEEICGVDLLTGMIDICNEVNDDWFGDVDDHGLKQHILRSASLLPGTFKIMKRPSGLSSVQINYAKPAKGLASLKKFGGAHPDMHDHPAFLTALLNLCHFGPDDFGGRFNILPWNAAVPMGGNSSISFFSARFYHCATGFGEYTVDKDSPFRFPPSSSTLVPDLDPAEFPYMRLTIPVYPDKRMIEPNFKWFKPELYNEKALGFFPSKMEHHLWMMSLYIVQEPGIRARLSPRHRNHLEVKEAGPARLIEASGLAIRQVLGKRIKRRNAKKSKLAAALTEAVENPSSTTGILPTGVTQTTKRQHAKHGGKCLLEEAGTVKKTPLKKRKRDSVQRSTACDTESEDEETVTNAQFGDDASEEAHGITRNGNPSFYANLFSYPGITPEITAIFTERASATLAALKSSNPAYDALMKDFDSLSCGTKIMPGMIQYTDPTLNPNWDAPDLRIPANPNYDCTNPRVRKGLEIEAAKASLKLAEQHVSGAIQDFAEAWDAFKRWEPYSVFDNAAIPVMRELCKKEGLSGYERMQRGELKGLLEGHFNGGLNLHVERMVGYLEMVGEGKGNVVMGQESKKESNKVEVEQL